MTHPLTDEKCMSLFSFERLMDESQPITVEYSMRAAADWQLEQVIGWIKECPCYDLDFHSECQRMIEDLKQAMRPQEHN